MIENLKKYSPYILVLLVIGNLIYFFTVANKTRPAQPVPTGAVRIIVVSPTPGGEGTTGAEFSAPSMPAAVNGEQPNGASALTATSQAVARSAAPTANVAAAGSAQQQQATPTEAGDYFAIIPTATTFFYSRPTIEPTTTDVPTPVGQQLLIGVPGITMSQISDKLTKEKGFACGTGIVKSINQLNCTLKINISGEPTLYTVNAYGRNSNTILFIYMFAEQGNATETDIAAKLSYVAALPFSDPALAGQASKWITNGMPSLPYAPHHDISIVIGGVNYRLYGEAPNWRFEMGSALLLEQ